MPCPRALPGFAALAVVLDHDRGVTLVEADVDGRPVGPDNLDLSGGAVLGVALDGPRGTAPRGPERRGPGQAGLRPGDRVLLGPVAGASERRRRAMRLRRAERLPIDRRRVDGG